MQTIKIDLAKRVVCPVILAQQEDVGRKVKIEILDNGQPYEIPAGTNFSVWYSGDSGSGNYTKIGTKSAFECSGNTVTVELITQMLTNAGKGNMTLVMHRADGTQLGSLQLPYWTEGLPGAGSKGAQQYYTAFQELLQEANAYLDRVVAETMKVYSGTKVPDDSLGKDGDLYILYEE